MKKPTFEDGVKLGCARNREFLEDRVRVAIGGVPGVASMLKIILDRLPSAEEILQQEASHEKTGT